VVTRIWLLAGAALVGCASSASGAEVSGPGVAEVDRSRFPISARDLVEVGEISGASLSPDGHYAAFRVSRASVATNSIALDWYVVSLAGGTPVRIGSGGVAQHGGSGVLLEQAPLWDLDSGGFRFRALVDGAVGIWHWRRGSEAEREIVAPGDISAMILSKEGGHLRYSVGAPRKDVADAERRAYVDGALVDHQLDIMEPIAGGTIEDGKRIMQRLPGNWFDRRRLLSEKPEETVVINLQPDSPSALPTFADEGPWQGRRVQSRDGTIAELEHDGGTKALTITRPDGSRTICEIDLCRSEKVAAIAWRPGKDMLLLFERAGSARETIWLWKIGATFARRLAETDGAQRSEMRPPRCAVGADKMICAEASAINPPKLVSIDYSGYVRVLADPNEALRSRIAAVATSFEWDRGVTGILLRPRATSTRLPVVVQYYHCAGFLKGGVGDEIPMLPLVESGIAVLCMDRVRAPEGSGTDQSYALALSDIDAALDGLVADGLIDGERVGIGGLSFGSEVALWAIRHSRRFAAATLASGQMSPIYYWANALPGRGFTEMLDRYWKIGDPDFDKQRWKQLAGLDDVSGINTPVLMQLPESEARFVIELHAKLKRAGKPAELYAFADEPHIKKQPAHKLAVYQRNLDWYRFWLKGGEDTDPKKSDQYVRWRSYRAGQSLLAPAP